jgi:hypothetical protein
VHFAEIPAECGPLAARWCGTGTRIIGRKRHLGCDTPGLLVTCLPPPSAFAEAEIVGACEKLAEPDTPVWAKTYVTNVEAFGAGPLAHDPATGGTLPHIHVSADLKAQSADGSTSHLLSVKVQFLSELLIVEVMSPTMTRPRKPDLYDVPLLTSG